MISETNEIKVINEAVPHVGKALLVFWGSREFNEYTDRLFFDTRDGARQGFPKPVMSAIHKLCELHDRTFPQFVKVEEDKTPFTFVSKRS